MKRQIPHRPTMRALCLLGISCVGVVLAGMHWATRAHAAEVGVVVANRLLSEASLIGTGAAAHTLVVDETLPCYQYIIPPADCTDGTGNSTGGDGDPNDIDGSQGTVFPSEFGVIGSYNGYTIVGWATQIGVSRTYNFLAEGAGGCSVFGEIRLSIGEAIMIDLGISANLDVWWVTDAEGGCA